MRFIVGIVTEDEDVLIVSMEQVRCLRVFILTDPEKLCATVTLNIGQEIHISNAALCDSSKDVIEAIDECIDILCTIETKAGGDSKDS